MKQFIFAAFILSVNAIFGVVCIYAAASATSWVEYDFFHIDMTVTSLWPLAFVPFFVIVALGLYFIGFFVVRYAAVRLHAIIAKVKKSTL